MYGAVQAYGYALKEQVALVAIISYKVTLFIMRLLDLAAKGIQISEPVWWDATRYLHFPRGWPPQLQCHTAISTRES